MARGGFISSELCVSKMADLVGSRARAQRILADALLNGSLSARGRPPREMLPCPPGQLIDLGSGLGVDVGPPKPVEKVPSGLWKSVDANDIAKWNWRSGWFFSLGYTGKNEFYDDVRFNETELNALLDKRRELISGEGPRARKKREALRDPSWEDWVAAIAILATEQAIHAHIKPAALLGIIDARLQTWGIEPKDPRTVQPTIRAVISRFGSHPPKTLVTSVPHAFD